MTPEEFAKRMKDILDNSGDTEIDHGRADDLLCEALTELGYEQGVRHFNDLRK